MDISKEVEKLSLRNLEHNKQMLCEIKSKLEDYLSDKTISDFVISLYSCNIDNEWLNAQCFSACNQIEKIVNSNSKFNEYYLGILKEEDLILLTSELICDISLLDQISGHRLNFDGEIQRDNYISSDQFFLNAKFAFFTNKYIAETTSRNFNFSSMPTLLRQSIEIKLKNMIGLQGVTNINGGFKLVSISSLLEFFKNNKKFLIFPVGIETLKSINTWTNTFVHTGVTPFCWQSLEAIDLIEKLFSIKDEESGSIHLHGFTYLNKGVTLKDIESALNDEFNAIFTLKEQNIEGMLIHL